MSRSLLLVGALLAIPSLASAGSSSRAWTAAKKVHLDAPVIMGIDVASAKSSEAFKTLFPKLLAKKPEAKDVLDKLQATCNFDPFTAISSVVAVVDDDNDKGAFYIALTGGWNATKLTDCGKKVAKGEGKTLTVKQSKKNVIELTLSDDPDKVYIGTIGKDVIVVSTTPNESTLLESAMTSKGTGETGKLAAKIDTSSTVWMAVTKTKELQPGVQMTAVYGTVHIASGTVNVDARAVLSDPAQATKLVDQANKDLPAETKSMPPFVQNIVKTLKLTANGPEIQATANAPEKDVLTLISLTGVL